VRTDGAWEEWLAFLLDGVIEVAESTTATTVRIVQLIERDRRRIAELGRGAATALRLHEVVTRSVVVRPPRAATELGLSEPPVYQAARRLEEIGVLREVTGRQRNRIYVYDAYLEILHEGT